eukprot:COSAG06_NODE_32628_length_503_cov_0.623762_2_plen_74_part_01
MFCTVVLAQSTTTCAVPPSTEMPNTAFGVAVKLNVATTSICSEPAEWATAVEVAVSSSVAVTAVCSNVAGLRSV